MPKPIILGAGLAGLTTALALAPMPVILVSPRKLGEGCSSAWAQGGIAAAVGDDDSAALHAADTLRVGAGLNNTDIVAQVTRDGAQVIEKLVAQGVLFDRDAQGALLRGLEAAHSRRRIIHAKDATGQAIMQALIKAARAAPSIEIIENATAQHIVADPDITGVILQRGGETVALSTRQIVLATGGAAALWRDTTNPHENWGSGLALAARAGATLGDLEFMQFHPTAIDIGRDPMPLASEALRGEGAILIDETGQRFTDELQPRDIVARAIAAHIAAGHRVFLDASAAIGATFATRFPTIHALCLSAGIDPATTPIPVRPAAHYHMGGVVTDANGRTDVAGLWACGEVACTGLHGGNRLASNSLLEAASFGYRVAQDIKKTPPPLLREGVGGGGVTLGATLHNQVQLSLHPAGGGGVYAAHIRTLMSETVGVTRNGATLTQTLNILSPLAAHSDMALVAAMIALAALRREESRGAHNRSDFPATAATARPSRLRLSDLERFT